MKILGAILAGVILASPAWGQGVCLDRRDMIDKLSGEFGEQQIGVGVANGAALKLWASPGGLTWTLFVTQPNGLSCLIGAGESWHSMPLEPVIKGRAS